MTRSNRRQRERGDRGLVRRFNDDEAVVLTERVVECLEPTSKFLRQRLNARRPVFGGSS